MSTSLLYHAMGIRGYTVQDTYFVGGEVIFWLTQPRDTWRCSACGSSQLYGRGSEVRPYRTVPIGVKAVKVFLQVPRVECCRCKVVRQVKVPFAKPRRTYTTAFYRYALQLLRFGTINDVARHLGVGWDLVKEIQKSDLQRRFAKPKLKHLREIAIDELHVGKGHRYITLVLDLKSGVVVYVGEGKGADALKGFWKRLRASHARVRAVAIDMAGGYIHAIRTELPKATLVFDRFHVMKLMNDHLSELRRELYHEATTKMGQKVLKGTRWLLLKNAEHLEDRRRECERLERALKLNAPLATAYYLKEDLRLLWEQPNKLSAIRYLRGWINRAEGSGIRRLKQMAKTLATHRNGILAYYDYQISTGPLEGTNNKIQTMKRQAYGFRDPEFLKLRILAIHETRYQLVG
jgi:transposase